eukprot:g766.t1
MPTEDGIQLFLAAMDTDGNMAIDREEFIAFFSKGFQLSREKQLRFMERSDMHAAIMHAIIMVQDAIAKRSRFLDDIFEKYCFPASGTISVESFGLLLGEEIEDVDPFECSEGIRFFFKSLNGAGGHKTLGDSACSVDDIRAFFLKAFSLKPDEMAKFALRSTFHSLLSELVILMLRKSGTDFFHR